MFSALSLANAMSLESEEGRPPVLGVFDQQRQMLFVQCEQLSMVQLQAMLASAQIANQTLEVTAPLKQLSEAREQVDRAVWRALAGADYLLATKASADNRKRNGGESSGP